MGTAAALACAAAPLTAQSWTNWTSNTAGCDGGSASWCGTLSGGDVSYTGGTSGGQLSNGTGTDYYSPSGAYTQGGLLAPDAFNNYGFIQIIDPTTGAINFSTAIVNPLIAFISVGAPSTGVTFTFTNLQADGFTVLSNNNTDCAFWGCGSYSTTTNSITGNEFSGVIQLNGTYSSIDFSTTPFENWYGITVGENVPTTATPEPGTMAMMATGLVGLMGAGIRRRRRNS